jgi:centromere protein S
VDEETIKMGVNATPQFIGALTEMVWAQIGMYRSWQKRCEVLANSFAFPETVSQDLEAFAK